MKWIIPILISLPLLCQGQGNLVPNGDFEDYTQCPETSNQITLATPWINDVGGCELYNSCSPPLFFPPDLYIANVGVPENLGGEQFAHSGDGYAGIFTYGGATETNGREYLQVPLIEPLQSGGYVISFWASLADEFQYAVGSIGAYLSDTLVIHDQFNSVLEVEPSIQSPLGLIMSDKDIWYHITDTFSTRYGGEQYLLIGNFKSTADSDTLLVPTGANNRFQSYYYIDDVSVVAIDSIPSSIGDKETFDFSVYPNPATEALQIKSAKELVGVRVLDMRGRSVFTESIAANTHTVDLKSIQAGMYILEVTDREGRRATKRIVKTTGP